MSPELQHELELARLSTDLKRQTAQRSLATKTLEVLLVTKFVYEYGFQNGRLVAERIVEDILDTIQRYWVPAADVTQPGSFTALAVCKEAVPGPYSLRLEDTPHVPVQLRLTTEDERRRLASGELNSAALRRERALRFFFEAEEQGGLLTLTDVAWFVGASIGTVSSWVRAHQNSTRQIVPTRGTLHDLGRGTTHKRLIVRLYLEGKLPSEIARLSRHAQKNVDRYIAGFDRVRLLARTHPPETVPALAGMSRSLVYEYLGLLDELVEPESGIATGGSMLHDPTPTPRRPENVAPAASEASRNP
jgi:hypothetical protein